jgi:UDP-glucose 4-epimerase
MTIIVTGGAGFIGSTLVDRLLADGRQVAVVDNLASGNFDNLRGAREHGSAFAFHQIDVRSPDLPALFASIEPEVVFHLAAQADVRVSVARPLFDAEVNVLGGLNVIESGRLAGARKIVVASSGGTIYGEPAPEALPVDERHPQHPVSPYGVAKKVTDDYLFAMGALHGLQHASMALANVYGPRQDPHGEAGVVAIFAGRLLAGDPCTVFGDGAQTRDFVYVDDVVDAFCRGAGSGSGVYNIGTGVETSVNQLYGRVNSSARLSIRPGRCGNWAGSRAPRSPMAPPRCSTGSARRAEPT